MKKQFKPRDDKCNHRRIKENFPFGRHSTSRKHCKDCHALVTKKMISDRIKEIKKRNRNQKQWIE